MTDPFETTRLHQIPNTRKLRGIVLDCDGVVSDTMNQHLESLQGALRHYGFSRLADADYKPFLQSHSSETIFRGLVSQHELTHPDFKDDARGSGKEKLIDALYAKKVDLYIAAIERDALPDGSGRRKLATRQGVEELLIEAENRKVPIAVGSASHPRAVSALIRALGLDGYLGDTLICHRPHAKPDADTVVSAMRLCGVAPKDYINCVVVEDTYYGALSGLAAGARVVVTVSSFTEIEKISRLWEVGLTQEQLRAYRQHGLTEEERRIIERNETYPRKVDLLVASLEAGNVDLGVLDLLESVAEH